MIKGNQQLEFHMPLPRVTEDHANVQTDISLENLQTIERTVVSLTHKEQQLQEMVQRYSAHLEEKMRENEALMRQLNQMISNDNVLKYLMDPPYHTQENQKLIGSLSADNKKLRNELQDLRGNIRVLCRVRPLKNEEPGSLEIRGDHTLVLDSRKFECDRVFHPTSSQRKHN